jgi:hypothetical protein
MNPVIENIHILEECISELWYALHPTNDITEKKYQKYVEALKELAHYALIGQDSEKEPHIPVFTHTIRVTGSLYSKYVFESKEDALTWIETKFPQLQKQYPDISHELSELDGLKLGDECMVYGEGSSVFTILNVIPWNADRYGFLLDSGWVEEVSQCYKPRE